MAKNIVMPLSVFVELEDQLPVYVGVQKILMRYEEGEIDCITQKQIMFSMFGTPEKEWRVKQYIKESMAYLYENGYIVGDPTLETIQKQPMTEKYFICISVDEYDKIMQAKEYKNILNYFCFILIRCINAKRYSTMSYDYISEQIGLSKKAIAKYNQFLEENKLVAIKHGDHSDNSYCRYDDRGMMNSEAIAYYRRIIREMKKVPKSYNKEHMDKLKAEIREYNEKMGFLP